MPVLHERPICFLPQCHKPIDYDPVYAPERTPMVHVQELETEGFVIPPPIVAFLQSLGVIP